MSLVWLVGCIIHPLRPSGVLSIGLRSVTTCTNCLQIANAVGSAFQYGNRVVHLHHVLGYGPLTTRAAPKRIRTDTILPSHQLVDVSPIQVAAALDPCELQWELVCDAALDNTA